LDCPVVTEDDTVVKSRWILLRLPQSKRVMYCHSVQCAIAYLSEINNGFDAQAIRARIGEPVPAVQP